MAEYNIYSQNIDTLISIDVANPITGFDYSIQNKQVAYSTGEGFLHEKLFLYDKKTNSTKLVFDPNQSIPNYNCGGWAQFDNIVWSINGNYLAFLSYMYTNTGAGINIYDLLNDKTIIIEKCDHYGLKQNLTWVNADSILYRREDLDEIYGYNLHDKLTLVENNGSDIYQLTLTNYPNPFNPITTIKYALPLTSEVKLTIYDIMGREVKSFNLNSQPAGTHELEWNGTNNNGSLVSSGIYLLHFNATSVENNKSFNKTAKLMLVK